MCKVITRLLPTTQTQTITQHKETQILTLGNQVLNQKTIQVNQVAIVLIKISKLVQKVVNTILIVMEIKLMFPKINKKKNTSNSRKNREFFYLFISNF